MIGTDNNGGKNDQGQAPDALTELFQQVSARPRPPAEDEQIVREALRDQWHALIQRKHSRRRMWLWAIAASLVLATGIGVSLRLKPGPGISAAVSTQQVALAYKVIGQALVHSASGSTALKDITSRELMTGQSVGTGWGSRLALRWLNGTVIRLDEQTELKLISAADVFLVKGRIYVDTAMADDSGNRITIATPQGLVRHIGTRFMTRVSSAGTSISVREGKVAYFPSSGHQQERTLALMGQHLAATTDGKIAIEPIPTWGADWEWTEHLSPGFPADGRSLADLLVWVGQESGRQVKYDSATAEAIATATILHGNLDLQPMQALSVATATSDLLAEVDDGLIVVRLPTAR